jgi:malonyl-CoA/methylmalonyl-CoA synthetase
VADLAVPDRSAHLPPGMSASEVDLGAGLSLPGAWRRAWAADPARISLSTLDGLAWSAEELAERTARAAGALAGAGLRAGDRLLMCAPPGVELVVSYVAALRLGLAVVPANPALTDAELTALVATAKPSLAVLDDPSRVGGLPTTAPDLGGLSTRPDTDAPLDAARPEDVALIIFTSGTTGRPKGVPLTHANLLATAHAVRIAWRWQPDDRLALSLPLFHMHGLGVGLHGSLVTGAGIVLVPRFEPSAVASAIVDGCATLFFGVPTMFHRLAASPFLADLARLRLAVSGSAPLPVDLHEAIRAGSGQVVLERYGMTETGMLASNPYQGPRRPGTVGLPLPGVELRLAEQPSGVAEVQVRGPNVVRAYLDNPTATADAYTVDGWFRTGDLGTLDPDGYLRISGRAKELIITGGFNVYPGEVEDILRRHPGVADAAAVGEPSPEWGETVIAYVVPAGSAGPGLTEDLVRWCEQRLAPYKRPRRWRLVDAIPRTALGKIQRQDLRDHELRGVDTPSTRNLSS